MPKCCISNCKYFAFYLLQNCLCLVTIIGLYLKRLAQLISSPLCGQNLISFEMAQETAWSKIGDDQRSALWEEVQKKVTIFYEKNLEELKLIS